MIELKNISKIYRVGKSDFYALDDVSLTIQAGEFVAIQGASGSGKTTMLNIIGCFDKSSSGSYYLDGTDISVMTDEETSVIRNEKIGFVLQDFALVESQTVIYNVMLPLLLGKTPYRKIRQRAMSMLEQVGILDQAKKKVNQLSGGQRQRVAIARAMVNDPTVILADEPTGQLDSKTGIAIMELLKEVNKAGTTVIMVTHDDALANYAHRKIHLLDGKVVYQALGQ